MANLVGLLKLIWRTGPRYCVGLVLVMVLTGLVPTLSIVINARLLDVLVTAVQKPPPLTARVQPLLVLLLLLGSITLATHILNQVQIVVQQILGRRVTNHLHVMIADKASSLDLAFFEDHEFYNLLINTASEALHRPMQMVSQLLQAGSAVVTLGASGVLLFIWQPWLVLIILVGVLAKFKVEVKFGRARFDLVMQRTSAERKGLYLYSLLTSDEAAKEVRLFRLRGWLLEQYRRLLDRMLHQDVQLIRRQVTTTGTLDGVLALVQPGLIGFIAVQAVLQQITVGQFSLYSQAVQQLDAQLYAVMRTLAGLYENQLFVSNLFHFLALQPDVEAPRPAHTSITAAVPAIEFRNVSFQYPGTTTLVLNNVSFRITPGEKIALVGRNGAGKTTLVKLLTGLYQPIAGQILLDGVDITTLDRDELRSFLSVIFQDYSTYHFSVAENIGLGDVEYIHEYARIETVAKASGFDQVVARLPYRYETVIGRWFEEGYELSGGQRQLLAVTRAMMRSAPILILDEPSAALDIRAEQHFFNHILDHPGQQQTVLFIAHRFTSVRHADRILVIEQGTLQEQGSHDELLLMGGRYAELFTLQAQMYTSVHDKFKMSGNGRRRT